MKVGIALYHQDSHKLYPRAWIDQCIESMVAQESRAGYEYIFYELNYGLTHYAYHVHWRSPNFRHHPLGNYADAMNYIYEWIFEKCDIACNVNIDDYYDTRRIRLLAETLEEGADVASSDYAMFLHDTGVIHSRTKFCNYDVAVELARDNNIVSNPGHMMKKHVFEKLKFDPTLVPREDLAYWKQCVAAGFKIVIRPEYLHYYRIHPNQSGNR
jgi:hypothetical protein